MRPSARMRSFTPKRSARGTSCSGGGMRKLWRCIRRACQSFHDEPVHRIAFARGGITLRRIAPAAAATGLDPEHVAGADFDADLLGLQSPLLASFGVQHVAMRQSVLATEDAA